jgi:hypothetical protein
MENHLPKETICGTRGKYPGPYESSDEKGSRFMAALPDGAVEAEDIPLLSRQEVVWAAVLTRVVAGRV